MMADTDPPKSLKDRLRERAGASVAEPAPDLKEAVVPTAATGSLKDRLRARASESQEPPDTEQGISQDVSQKPLPAATAQGGVDELGDAIATPKAIRAVVDPVKEADRTKLFGTYDYHLRRSEELKSAYDDLVKNRDRMAGQPGIVANIDKQIGAATEELSRLSPRVKPLQALVDKEVGVLIERATDEGLEKFTEKTLDGRDIVPNPSAIEAEADRLAAQYNVQDTDLKERIRARMKGVIAAKIIEPEVDKVFEEKQKAIIGEAEKRFVKGFTTDEVESAKATQQINAVKKDVESEFNRENAALQTKARGVFDGLTVPWKQQEAAYAAKFDQYQAAVDAGTMSAEEANAQLGQMKQGLDAAYAQYSSGFASANAQLLKESHAIGARYNDRFEQQQNRIVREANERIQKAADLYVKEFGNDPELRAKLNKAYTESWKQVGKSRAAGIEARDKMMFDVSASTMGLPAAAGEWFVKSTVTGLGGAIKGLATTIGSDIGYTLGEEMESAFVLPEAKSDKFTDLLDARNFSMLSGQLLGGMAPSLAASAGTAAATGGASVAVRLLATSLAGWGAETADIAGRAKDQMFERTGDMTKAEEAARKSFVSQVQLLPTYAFEGLPFVGGALGRISSRAGRVAAGGAIEYVTESFQEVPQGIAENNILAGRDAWSDFGEGLKSDETKKTLIAMAPVALLGGAGQVTSQSDAQRMQAAVKSYIGNGQIAKHNEGAANQWVAKMVKEQGVNFSSAVITALHASGNINEEQVKRLVEIQENVSDKLDKAKSYGLNTKEAEVYVAFAARAQDIRAQIEAEQDPIRKKQLSSILDELTNVSADAIGRAGRPFSEVNYVEVKMPNRQTTLMTTHEAQRMFADPNTARVFALIGLGKDGVSIKTGGSDAATLVDEFMTKVQNVNDYAASVKLDPGSAQLTAVAPKDADATSPPPSSSQQLRNGMTAAAAGVRQDLPERTMDDAREMQGKVMEYKGDPGYIDIDEGGKVTFTSVDGKNIVELGNEEGLPGLSMVSEVPMANVVNDDGSVTVYGNTYTGDIEAGTTFDKDGNASVTLQDKDGNSRTFRGDVANLMAYENRLRMAEEMGPGVITEIETNLTTNEDVKRILEEERTKQKRKVARGRKKQGHRGRARGAGQQGEAAGPQGRDEGGWTKAERDELNALIQQEELDGIEEKMDAFYEANKKYFRVGPNGERIIKGNAPMALQDQWSDMRDTLGYKNLLAAEGAVTPEATPNEPTQVVDEPTADGQRVPEPPATKGSTDATVSPTDTGEATSVPVEERVAEPKQKPVKEEVSEEVAREKPWLLSRDEFWKRALKAGYESKVVSKSGKKLVSAKTTPYKGASGSSGMSFDKGQFKSSSDEHKALVEYAIRNGEAVPESVLADYPGLAKEAATATDKAPEGKKKEAPKVAEAKKPGFKVEREAVQKPTIISEKKSKDGKQQNVEYAIPGFEEYPTVAVKTDKGWKVFIPAGGMNVELSTVDHPTKEIAIEDARERLVRNGKEKVDAAIEKQVGEAQKEIDDALGLVSDGPNITEQRPSPRPAKTGKPNTDNALKALSGVAPGLRIETPKTKEEYAGIIGEISDALGSSWGVYDPSSKRIIINPAGPDLKNTLFHEAAHPLLAALEDAMPERFQQFHDEIRTERGGAYRKFSEGVYGDKSERVRMHEALAQFMADVADGKVPVSTKPDSLYQRFKDFIKDILAALGFDVRKIDLSKPDNVRAFAAQFKKAMDKGIKIAGLKPVGGEGVSLQDDADRLVDGWYSRLDQAVAAKGNTQSGADWMKWAEARAKEGMMSMEEVKWTGLAEFLDGKKKVTPKEVRDFLKENRVRVEVSVLGDARPVMAVDPTSLAVERKSGGASILLPGGGLVSVDKYGGKWYASGQLLSATTLDDAIEEARPIAAKVASAPGREGYFDPTKFSQYQLPGGPLSRDTEILTDGGWVRIDAVQIGQRVLTRKDEDGVLEWQPVLAKPSVFAEELYHFKNQSIDMMVTANHKMVVKRRRRSSGKILRMTAKKLWGSSEMLVPLTGTWNGGSSEKIFGLDAGDVAEFMGWYIAEGSYKHQNGYKHTLQIAQCSNANPEKCERIHLLMERLGLSFKYYKGAFGVRTRQMNAGLKDLCHQQPTSGGKYIPSIFFSCSKPVIDRLLEGLVLGDGTVRKPGRGRKSQTMYFTKSKRLAGDVQALVVLSGRRASVRQRPSGLYAVCIAHKEWCGVDDAKHAIVPYNDRAYCVTVENHAIYVRRNGIAAFTGNSNYREVLVTLPLSKQQEGEIDRIAKDAKSAEEVADRMIRSVDIPLSPDAVDAGYSDGASGFISQAAMALAYYNEGGGDSFGRKRLEDRLRFLVGDAGFERAKKVGEDSIAAYKRASEMKRSSPQGTFRSSHFDEPNILVHLRLNDRTIDIPLTEKEQADIAERKRMEKERDALAPKIREAKRRLDEARKPEEKRIHDEVMEDVKAGRMRLGDARQEILDRQLALSDAETPELKAWRDLNAQWSDLNKRMPAEPKKKQEKILFVEELQSDWGQQGKKNGFATGDATRIEAELDALMAEYNKLEGVKVSKDINGNGAHFMFTEVLDMPDGTTQNGKVTDTNVSIRQIGGKAKEQAALIQLKAGELRDAKQGTPSAPFVTSTDTWVELGLKQAIRMAVEGGYDKIAWTTGEQQNERYDLSKQVDGITWSPVGYGDESKGRRGVSVDLKEGGAYNMDVDPDGTVHSSSTAIDGKPLDEVVGKDIADKIMSEERGDLSGEGLKIGGSGMKGFYDKILPNVAKKVSKKLGGEGVVGEIDIIPKREKESGPSSMIDPTTAAWATTGGRFGKDAGPTAQQSIAITPKMREQVGLGVPMMQKADPNKAAQLFKDKGMTAQEAKAYMEARDVPPSVVKDVLRSMSTSKTKEQKAAERLAQQKPATKTGPPLPMSEQVSVESRGRGVVGEGMVTVNEKTALKEQIRMQARAAREAGIDIRKQQAAFAASVGEALKELRGKVSPAQVSSLTTRAAKVNVTNPTVVAKYLNYVDRVLENANYAKDLSDARAARKAAKKVARNKKAPINHRQAMQMAAEVDVSLIEDPAMYAEAVNQYMAALAPTTAKRYSPMSSKELMDLMEKMGVQVDKAYKNLLMDEHGLGVEGELSAKELYEALEAEDIDKYADNLDAAKATELADRVAAMAGYRKIAIGEYTNEDISTPQQAIVTDLKAANTERMTLQQQADYIRSVDNIVMNDAFYGSAYAAAIARNSVLVDDALKATSGKPVRRLFSPRLARTFMSQSDAFRFFFGMKPVIGTVQNRMGMGDFIRGKKKWSDEMKVVGKKMSDFYNALAKKHKTSYADGSMTAEGMVAFAIQGMPGLDPKQSFEVRKRIIQQDIKEKLDMRGKLKREGETAQIVFDRMFADANTAEELLDNLNGVFPAARQSIDFLVSLSKPYRDSIKENAEDMWNEPGDYDDPYYIPIKFRGAPGLGTSLDPAEPKSVANKSLRPKQAKGTLARQGYKNLPTERLIDYNVRHNAYATLSNDLYDVHTSRAQVRINEFLKLPDATSVFGSRENVGFVKDMMKKFLISQYEFQDDESQFMNKVANTIRSWAVPRALGGFTQVMKQLPEAAAQASTILGGRVDLVFKDMLLVGRAKELLDKYAIGDRAGIQGGSKWEGRVKLHTAELEAAIQNRATDKIKSQTQKVGHVLMYSLAAGDALAAKGAWMALYEQQRARQGHKVTSWEQEAEMHDSDQERQDAAVYAESMIDQLMVSSDPAKMASISKKGKGGWENMGKAMLLPFSSFTLQAVSRQSMDVADLASYAAAKVAGNPRAEHIEAGMAARSLLAKSIGTATFLAMSIWAAGGLRDLLAALWSDAFDDDEEGNKNLIYATTVVHAMYLLGLMDVDVLRSFQKAERTAIKKDKSKLSEEKFEQSEEEKARVKNMKLFYTRMMTEMTMTGAQQTLSDKTVDFLNRLQYNTLVENNDPSVRLNNGGTMKFEYWLKDPANSTFYRYGQGWDAGDVSLGLIDVVRQNYDAAEQQYDMLSSEALKGKSKGSGKSDADEQKSIMDALRKDLSK